jgi:hypothetical protein
LAAVYKVSQEREYWNWRGGPQRGQLREFILIRHLQSGLIREMTVLRVTPPFVASFSKTLTDLYGFVRTVDAFETPQLLVTAT